jgi:glycolate oxidase
MELTRETYRALNDILGAENISEDPATLDCYAFQPFGGSRQGIRFFPRPAAVVLPGSPEDIQAIIRVCRRFHIRYRAHGTGYGHHNAPGTEDTIMMDLRRMNRIIDLDKKNMTIVVEPYVSFAQVQAEAMKVGLNCNVLGAGSQASLLASYTSMHGNNSLAVSQSTSPRNILGMEWVTPTAEIVRVGTAGVGSGWYSSEGPGPSLRGIIRGSVGAMGGLGVFTKVAAHLHPWHGPTELDVQGTSPYYEMEVPPNIEYHICEFPTWEQYADAMLQVGEAGIALAMHKTGGPGSHGQCVTGCNNEYYAKRIAGEYGVPIISFTIVMVAVNAQEHTWQVKTLADILSETGGKFWAGENDPTWKKRDLLTMLKACFIPRLAFRGSGMFDVDGFIGMDTTDHMALGLGLDDKQRDKMIESKCIVDDGTSNSWSVTYEGSHFALLECGQQFSSIDMDSANTFNRLVGEAVDTVNNTPLAFSWAPFGPMAVGAGPIIGNFHLWLQKIKKTFDPYDTTDSSMYIPTTGKATN